MVRMLPLKETLRMPQPELREGIFLTDWNITSALISKENIHIFQSWDCATFNQGFHLKCSRVEEIRVCFTSYCIPDHWNPTYICLLCFKSRCHSYIWHSSSVLKQTFSRVWGNLFDITLEESPWIQGLYSLLKGSTHLLHSESVPAMNIAIKGDNNNLLIQDERLGQEIFDQKKVAFPPELCGCSKGF